MAVYRLHSVAFLRKLLSYNPETGELNWLERPIEMFQKVGKPAEVQAANWNAKYAGKRVFAIDGNGYRTGRIFGVAYRATHIAWAMVHGAWPQGVIDHKNGVRDDDRIENLRDISAAENNLNRGRGCNNKSGVTGVYRHRNSWVAEITISGKKRYLGRFRSISEASHAREVAKLELGFYKEHGIRLSHLAINRPFVGPEAPQEPPLR